MERATILEELLGEHRALRGECAAARAAAEGVLRGEAGASAVLQARLGDLQAMLRAHNAREENLLGAVLPEVDAWGSERMRRMGQHHISEQAEALAARAGCGDARCARLVVEMLDDLVDHLGREEDEFLRPSVLVEDRYDVHTHFGG